MTIEQNPSVAEFQARQLWLLLDGWIEPSEALRIVTSSKQPSSVSRLDQAVQQASNETNLTQQQAARAYLAALASETASAAKGSSRLDAIVVLSDNSEQGISLQYEWLEWYFGERDVDWEMMSRGCDSSTEIISDWFRVKTTDGKEHYVEFDITSFFGRWLT